MDFIVAVPRTADKHNKMKYRMSIPYVDNHATLPQKIVPKTVSQKFSRINLQKTP
jgi:hypothetical protein